MKTRVLLNIAVVLVFGVGIVYAQPGCGSIHVGNDRMGVRVKDKNGSWEYITPGSAMSVTLVRFSNFTHYGIRITPDEANKIFGNCTLVYEIVLSAVVPIFAVNDSGGPRPGQKIPIFPANIPVVSAFFQDMRTHQNFLYAANGSSLAVVSKRHFAVTDGNALCELALCKQADIERLSGVVRDAAAWVVEKSAKKVRSLSAVFEKGKLKIDLEIETAGGRERMTFQEADAAAK